MYTKKKSTSCIVLDHVGGVMISVLTLNAVDRRFNLWSGQTKDYEIGICCFSAKHAAIMRKWRNWMTRNQDSVSEWSYGLVSV